MVGAWKMRNIKKIDVGMDTHLPSRVAIRSKALIVFVFVLGGKSFVVRLLKVSFLFFFSLHKFTHDTPSTATFHSSNF